MPTDGHRIPSGSGGMKTPKTPQDEALAFFSGSHDGTQPTQVWELHLEDDGGPGESKSVCLQGPRFSPRS